MESLLYYVVAMLAVLTLDAQASVYFPVLMPDGQTLAPPKSSQNLHISAEELAYPRETTTQSAKKKVSSFFTGDIGSLPLSKPSGRHIGGNGGRKKLKIKKPKYLTQEEHYPELPSLEVDDHDERTGSETRTVTTDTLPVIEKPPLANDEAARRFVEAVVQSQKASSERSQTVALFINSDLTKPVQPPASKIGETRRLHTGAGERKGESAGERPKEKSDKNWHAKKLEAAVQQTHFEPERSEQRTNAPLEELRDESHKTDANFNVHNWPSVEHKHANKHDFTKHEQLISKEHSQLVTENWKNHQAPDTHGAGALELASEAHQHFEEDFPHVEEHVDAPPSRAPKKKKGNNRKAARKEKVKITEISESNTHRKGHSFVRPHEAENQRKAKSGSEFKAEIEPVQPNLNLDKGNNRQFSSRTKIKDESHSEDKKEASSSRPAERHYAARARELNYDPEVTTKTKLELTQFSCSHYERAGIYADTESGCKVYHICESNGRAHTFECPSGTLFDQRFLVCAWEYTTSCAKAQSYYRRNEEIYTGKEQHVHL